MKRAWSGRLGYSAGSMGLAYLAIISIERLIKFGPEKRLTPRITRT